mmetsp:Transcript_35783/g.43197  ORF Transcript_35783/g.43197 Transcript_35783/m.43197 type:complete len:334 (+) Transcript_35783:118-1119(+)|eukprot:CAMPEP_0197857898 /NCGR_PEP_ID=MMETSP1438-20131217/31337_1 /TAXON_ID=1461541 /ORGANISM="Pterosperma sp., Strain CCMP1384" /LENGTH=333 /DNA_ID=CAMNT_0043473893 /DNA_START=95 /DNA_END=1096 /DNA_ORIENTATION=+
MILRQLSRLPAHAEAIFTARCAPALSFTCRGVGFTDLAVTKWNSVPTSSFATSVVGSCRATCEASYAQPLSGSRLADRGLSLHSQKLTAPPLHLTSSRPLTTSGSTFAEEEKPQSEPRRQSPHAVKREMNLKPYLDSPRTIAEPYRPKPTFTFASLFDPYHWRLRKDRVLGHIRSMYCLAKLYRELTPPFDLEKFKQTEAKPLYESLNRCLAAGEQNEVRKLCTLHMWSQLKNEMKSRKASGWSNIEWNIKDYSKINLLQARLVAMHPERMDDAFAQITLYFRSKQQFVAYGKNGQVVAGDEVKEITVEDIWVLERPVGRPQAKWVLAGRIKT